MGREARRGKEVENVGFKGSRRRRDQNLRETIQRCSPYPLPPEILSLQKYCNTRDICRPREEKGIKCSLKTPNLSFKEGAPGVVDVVGAIETRGAFAFLFAGLKIVPFYGDGGD